MHKLYLTGLANEGLAIYLHLWHKVRIVKPFDRGGSIMLTIPEYKNELLALGKSELQATILANSLGKLSIPKPKLALVPPPPRPRISPQPPITGITTKQNIPKPPMAKKAKNTPAPAVAPVAPGIPQPPAAPFGAVPPPPGAPPLAGPIAPAAPAAPVAPVFAPPAPPVQAPPPVAKDERNGVVKPSAGTSTRYVWDVADYITTQKGGIVATRAEVVTACAAQGQNASTATTQYGKWARYNGHVSAEVIPRKAPAAPAAPGLPVPPGAPPVTPPPVAAPASPRFFVARNGNLLANEPLTTDVCLTIPDLDSCHVMQEGTNAWALGSTVPRPAPVAAPVAPAAPSFAPPPAAPMPVAPAAVAVPTVDPAFQAGVDEFAAAVAGNAVSNPYTENTPENTQFLAGWADAASKVGG